MCTLGEPVFTLEYIMTVSRRRGTNSSGFGPNPQRTGDRWWRRSKWNCLNDEIIEGTQKEDSAGVLHLCESEVVG